MPAPYTKWNYKGRDPLTITAQKLLADRKTPSALSPFIFMTDPQRVPYPVDAVKNLPKGTTIIYRHFEQKNHRKIAEALRQVTFERQQQLLIGDDPQLAINIGADGVHFRRDEKLLAPTIWRQNCPDWVISMAGLKGRQSYSNNLAVLDGLLISSVFYSKSPSAGDPIGTENLRDICNNVSAPVFALGGISSSTAPKLIGTGAAGLAGIDGFLSPRM